MSATSTSQQKLIWRLHILPCIYVETHRLNVMVPMAIHGINAGSQGENCNDYGLYGMIYSLLRSSFQDEERKLVKEIKGLGNNTKSANRYTKTRKAVYILDSLLFANLYKHS